MRFAWLVLVAACHDPLAYDVATGPRDWAAHPAIASLAPAGDLYAASDVHGGYDRFRALLTANGLVDSSGHWAGGDATLVVAGDLFDKGPQGLEVIDLLRTLQADGGTVVVTLGNHEAEFFADPTNAKAEGADGIDAELDADQIDLVAVASGADPRGAWLRMQPFGAKLGDWFFSHAGNTAGRSVAELEQALEAAYARDDFRDAEFTGADSILEARGWYGDSVAPAAAALGVSHIVFGHDPGALGPKGKIGTAQGGALIRIDCGMSPDVDDSKGALLHVYGDHADEIAADGTVTSLVP